jgi:hypothetical protein
MKVLLRIAFAASLLPHAVAQGSSHKHPRDVVQFAVAPTGDDHADGSAAHPFRTLERAQLAVRSANQDHDVDVTLADGMYRLTEPLRFTALDGGRNHHQVTWQAAEGAHPTLSGAIRIAGWRLHDRSRNIFVATVPAGINTRDLWVNGHAATMGMVELPRSAVTFTSDGLTLHDPKLLALAQQSPAALELRATGFFTERIAPVSRLEGDKLRMQQPAWDNNLWGYDTIENPYHPELSHLYLTNSLAFLSDADQFFLDTTAGKLYLRLPDGVDPSTLDVELPRLTALVSVSGTPDTLVQNLTFRGLQFSHTTWLGPSGPEGYASQQSGSFLTGHAPLFPADVIATCSQGCPAFESMRNLWHQMPASIQVSAAERITFRDDTFTQLGQYALGIGNDPDATLSGFGLGAGDVQIIRCNFENLAGGAILAGGVQADAHHPRFDLQTNRALIVENTRIHNVSQQYQDNTAILSTYVTGAAIVHNDISDAPYDAIDIGYGWGIEDPGGNPNYRFRMSGYEFPQNPVYSTPTTHRDVVVASNRIHHVKLLFHDGGAIYNLSASPHTLITENYIYDNHGQIALYLDEGSRYITVRRNVVDDPPGEWLNVNTVHSAYPLRISPDNTAVANWHNGTKIGGLWNNYQDNLILDDHLVTGSDWPAEAKTIMQESGIEPIDTPKK